MEETTDNDRISRKEAVTKISKYAALTALGTFMILNPQKAQAGSHIPPGADGDPF
jgi:sorbitol-specific phosphotransferase system component IIC